MENRKSGVSLKIVNTIGVILAISIALNVVQYFNKLPYGKKRLLAEKNIALNTCISWDNPESIAPGVYIVELFTDTQKLAISTFTLK